MTGKLQPSEAVDSSGHRLEELLEGCAIEDEARAGLARYGRLVLEANRRLNVTGAKSADELAVHLLDSLTLVPYVREPYIDVGSGAGLPAIPVAIATGIPITIIEATAKKARLLEWLLAALGIRGIVLAERAEVAGHRPELRERFASGTARAVGNAPTVAELLLPLIEVDGAALLQRGTMSASERTALEDASLMLGAVLQTERELDANRRILVLVKKRPTPARFPRRSGVPAKRPLCST